jgi:hypothetical protein
MYLKQTLNWVLIIFTGACILLFLLGSHASAAACSSSGALGSVTLTTTVPAAGEYYVWVRYQAAAQSAGQFLLEVNGDACFSVGSASVPAQTWLWTNIEANGSPMKYSFADTGQKTVVLYGLQQDVRVDKIMFLGTDEQCSTNGSVPNGDGTNCDTGSVVGTSGGQTTTPEIVASNPDNVQKIEYYVDGVLIQTTTKPEGFDTTLVDNGSYTLTTKVAYKDGTSAEAVQAITVDNPAEFLGSVKRWARKNALVVRVAFAGLSLASLIIPGYYIYMRHRHKKLFLFHHGLAK